MPHLKQGSRQAPAPRGMAVIPKASREKSFHLGAGGRVASARKHGAASWHGVRIAAPRGRPWGWGVRRMRLGELLLHLGRVTEEQLESALAYQARWHCRLGEAFVHLRLLTPEQVQRALSSQLKVPFVRGEQMEKVPASVVRSVPADVLTRLRVCPLRVDREGSRTILYVATDQPLDLPALDTLAFVSRFTVRPVLALPEDIERTLRRHGLTGTRGIVPLELAPDDGVRLEITRGGDL